MKWAAAACLAALLPSCASRGGPGAAFDPRAVADTTVAEWGDEHPGLTADPTEASEAGSEPSLSLHGAWGETRSVSVRSTLHGFSTQVRAEESAASGAVEWNGVGTLRHAVLGVVRPTAGEGALLADRRDDAQLRARPTSTTSGLRLAPSTLVWGTSVGGGAEVAVRALRVSLGAWAPRDHPDTPASWASVEWAGRRAVLGAGGGAWRTGERDKAAVSIFAGRGDDAGWVGAEVGTTGGAARALARAVVGTRHQWRAAFAAGATPPDEILTPSSRWGAAIERTDAWHSTHSRTAFLTSGRSGSDSQSRRRALHWSGSRRVSPTATLEMAARLTRDEEVSVRHSPLPVPAVLERNDELRAHLTLLTRAALSSRFTVENRYRLELIDDHRDGVGVVVVWAGRARVRALDARLRVSALALRGGQVAYISNAGWAGTSAFSAASASGVRLAASIRVRLGRHTTLGAQADGPSDRDPRVQVFLSAVW